MTRDDPDYVPLQLANVILSGEGTGSLLMQELRTRRGYVYTVDSSIDVDQSGGRFSLNYASDRKNVARADLAALGVIRGLQYRLLPAVEVQKAKALLLAAKILPLDSYDGIASDMLSGVKDGYLGGSDWFWARLTKTTPEMIQHAMRRLDLRRFARVVVEPE
jgi:zinc protease